MTENRTIPMAFASVADRRSDQTAIIYLGTRYSYQKVRAMAESFAAALLDNGLEPGQRVVIYVPNSIQWIVAWLGIQRIGCVCVPITPIYTPSDLEYIANDSEAEAIVCADTNFGYVKKVLPKTRMKRVVITKMAELLPAWKRLYGYLFDILPTGKTVLDGHTYEMGKLLSTYANRFVTLPDMPRTESDLSQILYTGGTTKHPKGVPITHDLFLVSADEQIRVSEPLFPAEENVIMGNAPLFHILGQTCSLATLLVGGTLMLQPKVNLDATFESIQRFKARTMIGVPTLYRMMLEHDRLDQYDMGSVDYWYSAGDVLPVEVGKRWRKKFGKTIYQGYGATETCGGVAMCPTDIDNPPKSIGRIVAGKSVKIVDPVLLTPVKPGDSGELIVSSEHMVTRYIKKPEETAAAFIELEGRTWYRTADVVSMDTDGNLYFVDRTVDTIKHKGYRVSASEIEAVLQEHPAVVASCVIGVPDEKTGQRIKAYVVLKEDIKGITGYELIKWCRHSLVAYKIPQHIEFRDMLPKSKVGKLLRREIRDEEKRMQEQ
ncbi:MAG: class I adenylate-forming enzyme family protein [Thermodesulfobacteriota bacterium]|nr:class I adenylate-forming enzyme family protein [Thermodesulfobacteriota bacterium]